MGNYIDIAGQRFGRLVAMNPVESAVKRKSSATKMWMCLCDCGNTVVTRGSSLRTGHVKSCGCLHDELSATRITKQNETHNLSKTRLYKIWTDMKKRCSNPNHWAYNRYGGRGITVCDEWNSFIPFYEWSMSNGYKDTLTIDRTNNDGNYEPNNCCWVTRKEQANNKSNNVLCDFNGNEYTISRLSEMSGTPRKLIYSRIKVYGWSVADAISIPAKGGGRRHGTERLPD